MTNAVPQHSSKSNEWYTPSPIIEVARATMGGIDLDPASCAVAQERLVMAIEFFDRMGIEQPWHGRVFCNPPGGFIPGTRRSQAQAFFFKAVQEWMAKRIEACVFLGFTLELLRLSQGNPVLPSAARFPFCILKERTDFLVERDGKLVEQGSPTHANVLIFVCDDPVMIARFEREADKLGNVVVPRSRARR